jgi:hypothetical protein
MVFKAGVCTAGVVPQIWYAVGMADAWRRVNGLGQCEVCSMKDGGHMKGSLHYEGRAVDLRTHDLAPGEASRFAAVMKQLLFPCGFDVVHEADPEHLHIEYDPHPPRLFPGPPPPQPMVAEVRA